MNAKTYLCECHDEKAEKKPCGEGGAGLGKWRCSVTGRGAKVYRKKPRVIETAAPPEPLSDSLIAALREMNVPLPNEAAP